MCIISFTESEIAILRISYAFCRPMIMQRHYLSVRRHSSRSPGLVYAQPSIPWHWHLTVVSQVISCSMSKKRRKYQCGCSYIAIFSLWESLASLQLQAVGSHRAYITGFQLPRTVVNIASARTKFAILLWGPNTSDRALFSKLDVTLPPTSY